MRFDVQNLGDLDRAMQSYNTAATSVPMILVVHTPGKVLYRFIFNDHGIERQECDLRGNARDDL
jgi:hypothetical protein